jgi:hypothetical protein
MISVVAAALGACGSNSGSGAAPTAATTTTTVVATIATAAATTTPITPTTTTSSPKTTVGERQQAIWPTAGLVFTTPEAAAQHFVSKALGVPPVLGPYAPGDTHSGEIDVFSPGEGGSATRVLKSTLVLRQLGPSAGWFVLAAASDNATISAPAAAATVPRGPLTDEGKARGFEAAVRVSVALAGHPETLDAVSTLAGSAETPEPYHVTLDLSKAKPGDIVMILVRGGTGLETDPGDFGAIPVMVG